ncbi:YceI family protein [Psychrobium sp. 1_MG-2023]|uniref:YceI family protein n=1 Tax=Psychrobium sp. 1_MG-2023 TaxID=3062624 RepID=UPI000C34941C|nr:YceI family protein [Psychrobium sp. 1_MG-2023]MDP2559779.1 YceI family protein [Psychrobium sp. 1_MG-2023]PKF59113.1 YceI family protein [Alteromonadales bacterium alter-6D02]
MLRSTVLKVIPLVAAGALFSFSTQAAWHIDNAKSQVNFVSVKKDHVAEAHHFESISGALFENGTFSVDIDLTSVNTGIDIRDVRMKKHLFNTEQYPSANLKAVVSKRLIAQLPVGETIKTKVQAKLSLLTQVQDVEVAVSVTKVSADTILVTSLKPLLIKAQDYKLVAGIDKLRELAGLSRIGYTVPVSFVLRLTK